MERIITQIGKEISRLSESRSVILIAIDGSCTAGKTTLADRLAAQWDCNLFHMDDFFLRPGQRTPQRLEETGGNVDYERFQQEVLLPLKSGRPVVYRPYDCRTRGLLEPVTVEPKQVNIVEGTYSQHPYFGDAYDLRVFLTVSPEVREQRTRRRLPHYQKQFFEVWIPMEQRYFREFGIGEKADLVACPRDNQ